MWGTRARRCISHGAFFGSEGHLVSSILPRRPYSGKSSVQPKVPGPREAPSQALQEGIAPHPGLLRTEGLMHSLCECFKVLDESPTLSKILPAILGKSIPSQLSLFLPTLVHSRKRRAGRTTLLGGQVGRVN